MSISWLSSMNTVLMLEHQIQQGYTCEYDTSPFSNTTSETLDCTRLSLNIDTKHQPKIYTFIFCWLCDRCCFLFCSRKGNTSLPEAAKLHWRLLKGQVEKSRQVNLYLE